MRPIKIRWIVVGFICLSVVGLPSLASSPHNKVIAFKIAGVMVKGTSQARTSCFVRLMFTNLSDKVVSVPFEFSCPVIRKDNEVLSLKQYATGHQNTASNLTTCASSECSWASIKDMRKIKVIKNVLGPVALIRPGHSEFRTIEIPRPASGFYKLKVHFDNRTISAKTRTLADFNTDSPQFFDTNDEVRVLVE